MKQFIYFIAALVILSVSCRKKITIDLPHYNPKLVVEGTIETGLPPVVILTKSVAYFDSITAETFANMFVKGAIVKINDGSKEITLTEYCMSDLTDEQIAAIAEASGVLPAELKGLNYCVYTLGSGGFILGEELKTYTLTIEHEGKKWHSTTTIPKAVPLDSTWFKLAKGQDTLGYVWAKLSDPAGQANYYRWYTMRTNSYKYGEYAGQMKDSRFIPPVGSVFDDKFFDGLTFDFYYYRGHEPNRRKPDDYAPLSGYFHLGDTVLVKFTTIDRNAFLYLSVMEDQVSTEGSPFAAPSTIPTNIQGDEAALGAWVGYSRSIHTVICE